MFGRGSTLDLDDELWAVLEPLLPIKPAGTPGPARMDDRLTDAWSAHIDKIDRDRALPYADRTVWNEFDLCAAMIIRDHLQRVIDALPEGLARKLWL